MKRIIEDSNLSGLDSLLGETVLLMCTCYFYTGKLIGVNMNSVELEDPAIVYETGSWQEKGFKDSQLLPVRIWQVQRSHIESFGVLP